MSQSVELFSKKMSDNQKIVTNLNGVCTTNVRLALLLFDKLGNDPRYLKRLTTVDVFRGKDPEEIKEELSEAIEYIVSDSRIVMRELDLFIKSIIKDSIPKRSSCPFLRQVWDGEIYGDIHYAGFGALLVDITDANRKLKGSEQEMILYYKSKNLTISPNCSLIYVQILHCNSCPSYYAKLWFYCHMSRHSNFSSY